MKKSLPFLWIALCLAFAACLLTGCTVSLPSAPLMSSPSSLDAIIEPSVSPSPRVKFTITPSLTNPPTPGPTSTRRLTATPKPAYTPTRPPFPTLAPKEAKSVIQDLYSNNGGCRLPCWWGMHPGSTSWSEARDILEPIAFRLVSSDSLPGPRGLYEFSSPPDAEENGFGTRHQSFEVVDGVLEKIEIDIINLHPYDDLREMLLLYGKPEEFWISAGTYIPPTDPPAFFFLIVFYPKQGIMIYFDDPWVEISGKAYQSCMNSSSPGVLMLLWDPRQDTSFPEELEQSWRFPKEMKFQPLEIATGVSVDEYYQRLLDGNNCITTPIDLWTAP